jgi:hypothetical protein
MKRIIVVSILALAVLVAFVPISNAEMAKEGSATGISTYVATLPKILPQEKERVQFIYQSIGIHIADDESSPLHHGAGNCVGAIKVVKGVGKEMGLCTLVRPDGDKIYVSYEGTAQMGVGAKGKYEIVGGTGQCAGITGSGEYSRKPLKPPTKEHHASISKHKYSWKIP